MPATRSIPKRLLAVDDDVSSAELIVRVAERCAFEGFATSDSRGVMNLANALKPDILCVDICMPNIDALELFKLLSEASFRDHILIVSGQEQRVLDEVADAARAQDLKVLGALQKPIDFQALRRILMSMQSGDSQAA